MPVHDWTRVDAGIFHAFCHAWISEIGRVLNRGILPPQYYALPELENAETEVDFYLRLQSHIAVRHVSGDSLVAVVEIVSPGNKASHKALRSFVEKVAELLKRQIHLLILDLIPPTSCDPQGIHGMIWDEIAGQAYECRRTSR